MSKLTQILERQIELPTMNKTAEITAVAITRLKEFEPSDGYYLAFSGGKDSTVLYDLAVKASVKFDAHYAQGGIDPPELVRHIQRYYPDIARERPAMSVWKMMESKGYPCRQSRWCCEFIKEKGGTGRTVLTGIRWAESIRRANRGMYEVCRYDGTKKYLHPIIDWSQTEVWEYIRVNNLPYCSLYDEGFKRLGCVLCPMESPKTTQQMIKRFPKIAEAWHQSFLRLYKLRQSQGRKTFNRWPDGESLWQWWLSRKGEPKKNGAQCFMLDN